MVITAYQLVISCEASYTHQGLDITQHSYIPLTPSTTSDFPAPPSRHARWFQNFVFSLLARSLRDFCMWSETVIVTSPIIAWRRVAVTCVRFMWRYVCLARKDFRTSRRLLFVPLRAKHVPAIVELKHVFPVVVTYDLRMSKA